MDDDGSLLKAFAATKSEAAFAELVRRHVGLVYSAALPQLNGDAHRAEDVAQVVFCELAARAGRLSGHRSLAGWLYNTARFVAARARRGEERRSVRERAFSMNAEESIASSWREIEPLIDNAMQELAEKDREAVVLRFFQNQPLNTIGMMLRVSEDGARMRVNRALEKLRRVLERRGVKSSSAVLGAALAAHAITAPPTALAATLIGPALTSASATGAGLGLLYFMASAKLKMAAAGAVIGGLALTSTGLFVQAHQQKSLRTELERARSRVTEFEQTQVAPPKASAGKLERQRAEHSELLRLRDEATRLRAQLASQSAPKLTASSGTTTPISLAQQQEINRTIGLAKLNVTKSWGLALFRYAQANNGKMPAGFAEAAAYLPETPPELTWINSLTGAQDFEIMYRGSLNDLTEPAKTIIVRETTPFDFDSSGGAKRTYLFADGHSEVHRAADGNFEPWEHDRMAEAK